MPMDPAQDQPYPENAGLCSPPQGMGKEESDRSMVTMLEETGGKAWPTRNAWLQSLSHITFSSLEGTCINNFPTKSKLLPPFLFIQAETEM